MASVAQKRGLTFVDLFSATQARLNKKSLAPLTINGFAPTEAGYQELAVLLADGTFGRQRKASKADPELVHKAVLDKDFFWNNDYNLVNGVHTHGQRYDPFGPQNYPAEILKTREMMTLRDGVIHGIAAGKRKDLAVEAEGYVTVKGDIAWGGNWFFLVRDPGIGLLKANLEKLMGFAKAVRKGLETAGIRGDDGGEIDHIEVVGDGDEGVDSRNFVLCPGAEYDRSPCGTGVSAKLACLYVDGDLKEGEVWRQAGILGGVFEGKVSIVHGEIIPEITGEAFVTAVTEIVFSPGDPYQHGIG
jgi:hypothetical protein